MSPIELQIVNLVMDAQGELTMNQLCAIGVRWRLADAIAGELDCILAAWQLEQDREGAK